MSLILLDKHRALPKGSSFVDPGSGVSFPNESMPLLYSWESFLQFVRRHRAACNGDLDIGWELRVEHEFCAQNPQIRSTHYVPKKDLSITVGDVERFGYTLLNHVKGGAKTVPQDEANRRAQICLKCPYKINSGICSWCNNLVPFFENAIFGKKTTPYDDELGNCGVCKCYNKIAVHYPLEVQSVEGISMDDFPDHCWKKVNPIESRHQ